MPAAVPGRVPPKRRTFEVPSDVHDTAMAKSYAEHRYLTEVILDVLHTYVRRPPRGEPVVSRRMPGGRDLKKVSVRVPDQLWDSALAQATERGDALAEVIGRGLAAYATRP